MFEREIHMLNPWLCNKSLENATGFLNLVVHVILIEIWMT
jgi:hypothetical protein